MNASLVAVRASSSLRKRRYFPSQANVRSTTQRFGATWKCDTPSETLAAVQGSATNVLCPFHHLADIAPIGPNDPHVRPLPVDVAHHQPCYVPILERRGLLDVGNTKMMSLSTCAWLQAGQDYYLGSLSAIQVSVAALEKALEKVWSGEQALMTVARRHATGKRRTVARDMKSSVTRRR
jgi:hypothetical protein